MIGPLSSAARLDTRDRGARLHAIDRALVLLWADDVDAADDPAALSLAERDRQLLARRRANFGDRLECLADCDACGATQEFSLSVTSLLAELKGAEDAADEVELDGYRIALRALDSRDLAAAVGAVDAAAAALVLAERAIVVIRNPRGERVDTLPLRLHDQLNEHIEAKVASAEIALDLACADCHASWTARFDIGQYFWAEIDDDARRLLTEIAALALHFGWSEADILAMPASRRRTYLELAGAA